MSWLRKGACLRASRSRGHPETTYREGEVGREGGRGGVGREKGIGREGGEVGREGGGLRSDKEVWGERDT